MKVRRPPLGVIVPLVMVGLLAVLATLQYRWLGQVSEAEREQLRRSFTQRARDFADDLDREISRAYATLQLKQPDVASRNWAPFAAAVDSWRGAARFPEIVRGIYLAEQTDERLGLRAWSEAKRAFDDQASFDWPARLEPVRRQLTRDRTTDVPPPPDILRLDAVRESPARVLAIALGAINVDVPALIISVSPGAPLERVTVAAANDTVARTDRPGLAPGATSDGTFVWIQQKPAHLVVELDETALRQTVLPSLAAQHFPDPGAHTYRLAVLSSKDATLFARGFEGVPGAVEPAQADVVLPLMTVRLDMAWSLTQGGLSGIVARRVAAPDGEAASRTAGTSFEARVVGVTSGSRDGHAAGVQATSGQIRIARPGWRLVLQHGAGSLDEAVTQARRRNLALSFGILGVLAMGVVLVLVNARRSEQLAAKQMEFVATVSHELRTPLTVIRSAAQNLSAGVVADPGQTKRYGDLIDGEGRRLTDMVEQVLDYAGLSGNRTLRLTQLTDAGALVSDVVAACRPVTEAAGCTVEISVEEGLFVLADQDALRRAIQNLLTNAAKHACDGRWIGVRAAAGSDPAHPTVTITVSDRGRGIPAGDLPHVFDAFYRGRHAVEQQVRGNGLGLNLVRRIVEAHGGRVGVQSAAGEGSTFTITLPAVSDAAGA